MKNNRGKQDTSKNNDFHNQGNKVTNFLFKTD